MGSELDLFPQGISCADPVPTKKFKTVNKLQIIIHILLGQIFHIYEKKKHFHPISAMQKILGWLHCGLDNMKTAICPSNMECYSDHFLLRF